MVGVEEGREFRFRGDLYSQESTFPLVFSLYFYQSNYDNHRNIAFERTLNILCSVASKVSALQLRSLVV